MNKAYDRPFEEALSEYVKLAERWFKIRLENQDAFEARLRAGLRFGKQDPYEENKIALTRHMGLFSSELFQAMICGGESYKPMIVSILWDRLFDAGVVIRTFPASQHGLLLDHQINERLLLWHLRDDTFANLFASPARLPERYAHAVAAVDVIKNDNYFRGTGFVVQHGGMQCFVTGKHNVDPAEGIKLEAVTSAAGETLSLRDMILSDRYDIAVAGLADDIQGPCFALSDTVEVFDEVFTLGYPLVPRADSILLGHRGEMNGRANLYMEQCAALLISNLVSPGSSGGPVLTRDGHCVGMTINWLEGQWGDKDKLETMRFSAALPAELLREALGGARKPLPLGR